jgi:hypothetical protein
MTMLSSVRNPLETLQELRSPKAFNRINYCFSLENLVDALGLEPRTR